MLNTVKLLIDRDCLRKRLSSRSQQAALDEFQSTSLCSTNRFTSYVNTIPTLNFVSLKFTLEEIKQAMGYCLLIGCLINENKSVLIGLLVYIGSIYNS